jgi:hypothetical protein
MNEAFYGEPIAPLIPIKSRKPNRTIHHDKVQICGHKYDGSRPPNTNCESCWFTWFNIHGKLVQATEEAFQKYGKEMVVGIQGEKFFKMWLRFMATVANMKNVITGN